MSPGCDGGPWAARVGKPSRGWGRTAFAVCLSRGGDNTDKKNHHQKYRSGWKNTTPEMFPNYLGKKRRSIHVPLPLTFQPIDAIPAAHICALGRVGVKHPDRVATVARNFLQPVPPAQTRSSLLCGFRRFPVDSCLSFSSRVSRDCQSASAEVPRL